MSAKPQQPSDSSGSAESTQQLQTQQQARPLASLPSQPKGELPPSILTYLIFINFFSIYFNYQST